MSSLLTSRQVAHALKHFLELWLQHAKVVNCLKFAQETLQLDVNVQFGTVLVVLEERPEFFQTVELTC